MSLVTNDKLSLYGGVNQQSAEHRTENQVEEMINAIPTIDRGLVKRNPSVRKELSEEINYDSDIWNYEYDRGTAGDSEEQYNVSITNAGGMEIININTGKVYNEANGKLTFSATAKDYLYPFVSGNGYAATTIKDTTFLVNKSVFPRLKPSAYDPQDSSSTRNVKFVDIPFKNPHSGVISGGGSTSADANLRAAGPCSARVDIEYVGFTKDRPWKSAWQYLGSTTIITVDGISLSYTSKNGSSFSSGSYDSQISLWNSKAPENMLSYISNLAARASSTLETSGEYSVTVKQSSIRIERNDGSPLSVSISMVSNDIPCWYNYRPYCSTNQLSRVMKSSSSDYFGAITNGDRDATITIPNNSYLSTGFIWVQRAVSVDSYTYLASVKRKGQLVQKITSVTGGSTSAVATALATEISALTGITAVAVGSIVKITTDDDTEIEYVTTSDSFGNQASKGFAYTIASMNDLPSNMEFEGTIVKVSGTENGVFQTYWVKFDGSVWKETKDPAALSTIDETTMPYRLTRNGDDTFTLEPFTEWETRNVGDDETNPYPSFIANGKVTSSPIKDIFFFKNRLGFITSTTAVMSEVGKYGNFWRTTVFAILDSDPIDTAVDSNKAIELEYASYLEDSLMLFADKAQFKLSGSRLLSPSSVQISQTSAYETDRNVRPIFLNDKIFFVVKRGENSALYEYFISENSDKSVAVDISAHIQTYLPNDISKLSGSPVNSMLFAFARSTPDTVYVYKYYDVAGERLQSAWFKWTFNGDLFNAFSFGKYLNILIARKENIAIEDWVVGSGLWDMSKKWDNSKVWVMSPESLSVNNQFEQVAISPKDFSSRFMDDDVQVEDTNNVVSMDINATFATGNVLARRNLKLVLYSSPVIVTVSHTINSGSFIIDVLHGTKVTSATTIAGTTKTVIEVPYASKEEIHEISITPEYNVAVDASIENVSAKYKDDEEELIYNDGVNGWYIDNIAIPSDPLSNIGDWVKIFGTKSSGSLIPTIISIGEWVLKSGDKANTRGTLQCKTLQVTSEEGSAFSLVVEDINRKTTREIKSKYTVGRKPMMYGDAKDIRTHIVSNEDTGFRINTVSFEGNFNTRNNRV